MAASNRRMQTEKSLAAHVTALLRADIAAGKFAPGERLYSRDLSTEWDVSITPVREAFRILTAEGLLESLPQRGCRVASITFDECDEIYGLRLMLEPNAVSDAVEKGDSAWRSEVQHAYEVLEATNRNDRDAWTTAHKVFHSTLRSACTNSWLLRIVENLANHSDRYRALISSDSSSSFDQQHKLLAAACVSGDSAKAAQLAADHLEDAHLSIRNSPVWARIELSATEAK